MAVSIVVARSCGEFRREFLTSFFEIGSWSRIIESLAVASHALPMLRALCFITD